MRSRFLQETVYLIHFALLSLKMYLFFVEINDNTMVAKLQNWFIIFYIVRFL